MKIHELPQEVILKIAAGEVVTGCFSVVKELVENALDAEATTVEVEIKAGGKEYIRVSDNGIGMLPEELKMAIKPHTTSKIQCIEDLERILTYGFRGEALSTISSVSRMRISSMPDNADLGLTIEISGGKIVREKSYIGPKGTTVEVYDLLFNTPARRKFLKSQRVEGRMVTEIVQRFILAIPDAGFKYIRDGELIYDLTPAERILERIPVVFPELSTTDLLEVKEETSGISITGYITFPERTRFNRLGEMVFVNGRYVRQPELNYAIEKGYGESLEKGRFPFAILFISVNPEMIDVNIHPQKLEVRFSNPSLVFDAIKRAVRNTLRTSGTSILRIEKRPFPGSSTNYSGIQQDTKKQESDNPEKARGYGTHLRETHWEQRDHFEKRKVPLHYQPDNELLLNIERTASRRFEKTEAKETGEPRLFGVFGERYILAETKDGLLIVDQHAAHERLIYEKLKKAAKIQSQKLLSPIRLTLEDSRKSLLREKKNDVEKLGFQISFEGDRIFLTGIPSILSESVAVNALNEVLDELRLEGLEEPEKIFDHLLSTLACKSAIKTGDRLSGSEAKELLEKLLEEEILFCPHGRPVSMLIRFKDLDRHFSR